MSIPRLGIRFDFRNPAFSGTTMAERYSAALDMVGWAESLSFERVVVSEHHGSDDGYLPSPLVMSAAIAARTSTMRLQIAAVISSFHHPLRLAEDAAVLDNISNGRLELVLANGYVSSEFLMFNQPMSRRAIRTEQLVEVLRRAWTGEPFTYEGRTAVVTPTPLQRPGPPILLGGGTRAVALRAARIADGFAPSAAGLWEIYSDAVQELGRERPAPQPSADGRFIYFADDPDRAWERIAPFAMHEMNAYGRWMQGAGIDHPRYRPVGHVDELKGSGQYYVVAPHEFVTAMQRPDAPQVLTLHPLMGGIPPELAWESLRLFETEVLPRLASD
jgi:alkanesulfonate monooxygenase SsuD/methylene tetrahydromethanopterin reductase-like flavin-dependent oxidoreductase (luciferase family)